MRGLLHLALVASIALSFQKGAEALRKETPGAADDKAAIHAVNAQTSEAQAAHAANVAHKVAAHAIRIGQHAGDALRHAQDALHGATVAASALTDDDASVLLRRASDEVDAATRAAAAAGDGRYQRKTSAAGSGGRTTTSEEYTHTRAGGTSGVDSAADRAWLRDELDRLQEKLDAMEADEDCARGSGQAATEAAAARNALREEIRKLRERVKAERVIRAQRRAAAEEGAGGGAGGGKVRVTSTGHAAAGAGGGTQAGGAVARGAGQLDADLDALEGELRRMEETLKRREAAAAADQGEAGKFRVATDANRRAEEERNDDELKAELEQMRERLDVAEDAAEAADYAAGDGSAQRGRARMEARARRRGDDGEADVENNQKKVAELEARLKRLQEMQRKMERIEQLEDELDKMPADHPDRQKIGAEIARLKKELKEMAGEDGVPKDSEALRKEIDSVRKQLKELGADPDSITAGKDLDVDSGGDMPYGELEPFGREDTAQEVTTQSIGEQDEMVDQLERAEVAEEKRAVFRALTRLRGAVITAYDGIARTQSANIDEYNKKNKWRDAHPMHHLAEEEADYEKWAFPPPPEPYAQLANGPAAAPAAAEAKASAPAAAA